MTGTELAAAVKLWLTAAHENAARVWKAMILDPYSFIVVG